MVVIFIPCMLAGLSCRMRAADDRDEQLYEDRTTDPDDDRCSVLSNQQSRTFSRSLGLAPSNSPSPLAPPPSADGQDPILVSRGGLPSLTHVSGGAGLGAASARGNRTSDDTDEEDHGLLSRSAAGSHRKGGAVDEDGHLVLVVSPTGSRATRPSRFRAAPPRPTPGPRPSDPASSLGEPAELEAYADSDLHTEGIVEGRVQGHDHARGPGGRGSRESRV